MKKYILLSAIAALMGSVSLAHDEGHGPKISGEVGLHKGKLAAVIAKSEADKGAKAKMIYKGELVRTSDKIYVYIFPQDNLKKPLDLNSFDSQATATLIRLGKKGKSEPATTEIPLEKKDGAFIGELPKVKGRYNIDVVLKNGTQELLVAFDNLR